MVVAVAVAVAAVAAAVAAAVVAVVAVAGELPVIRMPWRRCRTWRTAPWQCRWLCSTSSPSGCRSGQHQLAKLLS
jgi:hypothetical protein